MKDNIHPKYFNEARIVCGGCGSVLTVGSTVEQTEVTVCSKCHPFFTGTQKLLDTEGRVDRFRRKYAKFNEQKKAQA